MGMEFKARIFLSFILLIYPFWIWSSEDTVVRTVSLKVAVDEEFRRDRTWRFDVQRLITEASRVYEEKFGIRFAIEGIQSWDSNDSQPSMQALLKDLIQNIGRGEADIVLGLTSQPNLKNDLLGLASYMN